MDEAVGLAHRVGTRGAGRHNRNVGTLGVIGNSHIATGNIANHFGNEERRNTAQTVLHLVGVLALEGLDAADAAAYGGAETARVDILADLQAAVLHGLCGCREGIECEGVVVADHRLVDTVVFGMEVLDLGGDFHRQVLTVDLCDVADAAHTVDDVVPQRLDIVSKWGYTAHACYDYFVHCSIYNMLFIII